MLILEALRAKFGDALLLHSGPADNPQLTVIDGGPTGVYADALKPRLLQLRAERGLDPRTPLPIELLMVSHIDDDHITGVLDLTRELNELREARRPLPWRIRRAWHNSFDDILGNTDLQLGVSASGIGTASLGEFLGPEGSLVLASVKQGRDLRHQLDALSLGGNAPFRGLVLAEETVKPVTVGDLTITVVGPGRANLLALQEKWDKEIGPRLRAAPNRQAGAEIAAYVDRSVHNLSSIVMLVESQGKRLLLTGDGRGDHTLYGLKTAGLLKDGRLRVDVLKVPHHGSVRNVDADYFKTIVADHYVISADGKFANPDVETLRMISAARPDDGFTVHLTYPTDAFNVPAIGAQIAQFFAAEKAAGRGYRVVTREAQALSVRLGLA